MSAASSRATPGAETVGVIELGTTSVRMVVAQIGPRGPVRVLDTLQQPLSLGKDAFTSGSIEPATTEACVQALRGFLRHLAECGVSDVRRIRLVATSAVREASNQDAFLDRITIATGLRVELLDEAEVSRLTYLAVYPALERAPGFRDSNTVVVEVGGGSTAALVFRAGRVDRSHLYRLGSLRLRSSIDAQGVAPGRVPALLARYVRDTAARVAAGLASGANLPLRLVVLGSEARFACMQLVPGWQTRPLTALRSRALAELTERMLRMPVDEVVRRHRMTYPEAETLGPALLICTRLAQSLRVRSLWVGDATLRSGMLAEMAGHGVRTREFERQILNSALTVARRYRVDLRHARSVAGLCVHMFRALRDEHGLGPRHETVLVVAALLHETGYFVNEGSHHKHSYYLIRNSDLFGLSGPEQVQAALAARYHRGAVPRPTHPEYMALPREERLTVSKLAAILRAANALDGGGRAVAGSCRVRLEAGTLAVEVPGGGDLAVERQRLRERGTLFERVYGLRLELRPLPREGGR